MFRSANVRSAAAGACLLWSFGLLAGCHEDHPHHPHSRVETPAIHAIEVSEFDTVGSHLEIEVHLYDARTGRLLGCSGDDDGLARVDTANILYRVNAHFVDVGRGSRLTWWEIAGRDLFVRVYEDDLDECPAPPGELDDFIGQSPVFGAEELRRGIGMEFDDVLYLELGLDY